MSAPTERTVTAGRFDCRVWEKGEGETLGFLGGLRGRLNNPKFAASAPENVVEETRANLALREEEEAKIKDALDRLAELQ